MKTSDACQRARKTNDKKKAPLILVPFISEIFSRINIGDCCTLPVTLNGNRYMITAMCLESRYRDTVAPVDVVHL